MPAQVWRRVAGGIPELPDSSGRSRSRRCRRTGSIRCGQRSASALGSSAPLLFGENVTDGGRANVSIAVGLLERQVFAAFGGLAILSFVGYLSSGSFDVGAALPFA